MSEELIAALEQCDAINVERILASGADPSFEDDGHSALGLALEKDDVFSAKLLIDAGAKTSASDLYEVRSTGMLRLFEASGLDLNVRNEGGETPLYCNRGYELLQTLLERGADPQISTNNHETALSFHASWGNLDAVEILLRAGADPNHHDPEVDATVLFYAVQFGHRLIVEALIEAGADVNFRNAKGRTAMSCALESGNLYLAELLIEHKADVAPECAIELKEMRRRMNVLLSHAQAD